MTIWRGEGGGGDATTDSEINFITSLTNSIVADTALTTANAAASAASALAAATSASAASASAISADASANSAANSYDSFDDRYLGSKTVAPTLDNDGNALLVGALYWNSVTTKLFVWSGTIWRDGFFSGLSSSLVTATDGQTVVTTPSYTQNTNTIQVYVNGLKVISGTDFIETSSTSITFSSGLTLGDEVEIVIVQSVSIGTTVASNVSYTPTGTIEASNVQDALSELSSEKVQSTVLAASGGSSLVGYLPSGTGAISTTVQNKLRESVSVKDFGAVGDGTTDDTAALTSAIAAAALSGAALYIPAGTYKYTTTLTIPGTLSGMYGDGLKSILNPNACDGLTFTAQGSYSGGRFFNNFCINGTNTDSNNGLIGNMSASSGNRVTGIDFSNIGIQNFGFGMYLRGFWDTQFRNCYLFNNYQGVLFIGQNIRTTFVGGSIQRGTITGTGTTYGIRIITTAGESTQSTQMFGLGVYAYDINVCFGLALLAQMVACDISVARSIGIQIISVTGGITVRDCWVQTLDNAGATVGIKVEPRAAIEYDKITLDNNEVIANTSGTTGSIGIQVGYYQNAVTITNNRIEGFERGISLDVANAIAKWNSINATVHAVFVSSSWTNSEIGPNIIQAGNPITFTSGSIQPQGLIYYATGSFTATLTGMTATTTGTVNWTSNGNTVTLLIPSAITGTSNTTSMVLTGMPQAIRPFSSSVLDTINIDNGVATRGTATIAVASGNITFAKDLNGGAFTASGSKGISAQQITFARG